MVVTCRGPDDPERDAALDAGRVRRVHGRRDRTCPPVFGQHASDGCAQYEALRRVHLIPAEGAEEAQDDETVNANVFRNLDSPVSEGGENFSTGCVVVILSVRCH